MGRGIETSVNTRQEKVAILVVEDEAKMRRLLELQLGEEGFVVHSASDAEAGLQLLVREKPDLVVTDLRLPGMSGLEFLQAVKRVNAALPVVVMTAYGTVESAVEAMKIGASDFVTKPFSLAELVLVIRKELDSHRLREENRSLREALGRRYAYDNIVAQSDKMQAVLALVERVAPTNSTVLLGGESGVGKDLVAAPNRDLRAALEEGTFREDLYYRLNVVAIDIPPLRDHKEDIPALANYFLEHYARESAKSVTSITPEAMKRLVAYHWPGNVRELQNIIERGVTLSSAPSPGTTSGTVLDVTDIHLDDPAARTLSNSAHVLPPGMTLEQWEDETIREALRRANGNKSQAARTLGLSRNALRYRLSKLGVPDPEVKEN